MSDVHAHKSWRALMTARLARVLRREHGRKRVAIPRWLKRLTLTGFVPAYYLGMVGIFILCGAASDLPKVDSFWSQSRPISVQILDRYGRDILVRGAQEATPVSITELPQPVREAVLAVEDRRFYNHVGVDPIGLTRAFSTNMKAGKIVQGGSTLSQQLAKNVFLTSDKTMKRKLQETLLAVWLERTFSKDEIFEKYLNRIYFGGNAWGLEAASQQYFRKPANEITLGEAAIIAALLKGPTRYNPVSSPERSGKRTALVLESMERSGFITRAQRSQALAVPIKVYAPQSFDGANYFTDWIWEEMIDAVGLPSTDIIIRTTLDSTAQAQGQAAIDKNLDVDRNATQAAIVTLDGSGGVRAMIGGASYGGSQFNRAVQAKRQPGSAFKPFVYLAAFEAGLTPWDMRIDAPIRVGDWEPRNFTKAFKGYISLETAFALSINTVAVILSEEIGKDRVVETASKMGLADLKPYRSLALGAQDVSPLDLTAAYLPFANWGDYAEPHGILTIATSTGKPLFDRHAQPRRQVVSSKPLGHINRIAVQTVKNGTAKRARLQNHTVAGKTGTTNDYRDAWFIGYIPDLITGVWVGNDDNSSMKRVTGGNIPALIWKDMMEEVTRDIPQARLPMSRPPVRADQSDRLDVLLSDLETALPADYVPNPVLEGTNL